MSRPGWITLHAGDPCPGASVRDEWPRAAGAVSLHCVVCHRLLPKQPDQTLGPHPVPPEFDGAVVRLRGRL